MAMAVFIGACCIIGLAGPSELTTAPRVFEWVMNRNTPVMM